MKVILAMVQSLDGKTTKWHDPHLHTWTSQEDQQYFAKLIEHHKLIIMGRKTYEVAKPMIKPQLDKFRIVLTNHPEQFDNEKVGQLQFTKEGPTELVRRLEKKGYKEGLLVGGAHTNTEFLEEHLVDEVWLTIEPKIFGSGNELIQGSVDVNLELLSIEKLNERGTLLLKYKVV